ncbi:hypothetical protein P4278_31985 [Bacillus thuringiensis]|nr:hypothetical protein [Bacillus thuringiensis]MED2778149.1 hypothetical protein [Bacillus thuringiensis]MED2784217.1 hypothetical protein [Bacillus thuringiensis]
MWRKVLNFIVAGAMLFGVSSSFVGYSINADKKEIKAQYVDPGPGGG